MEVNLSGDEMKVYVGIDIEKDKFDRCAMDRDSNILLRGVNYLNNKEEFTKFSETLKILGTDASHLMIAMKSTVIYRMPLY